MRRVRLDELEPGLRLAQDIDRHDGMRLVAAGTELTENLISLIRRMTDLEAVAVEGASFESVEEAESWRREELKKLVRRFSLVAGDPFMERLRRLEARRIIDAE